MSIAFVPLYIRYLGVEAYGVVGLLAVIQAFMLILDFGMTPTLMRESALFEAGEHEALRIKDLIRSVESVALAICILLVIAVAIAASYISGHWVRAQSLNPGTISESLMIGGALIAIRLFESIYRGTLYGLHRQFLCNGIAAIFATLRGAGAVAVIALFHAGLPGFFAWQVGISALAVLTMRLSVGHALPPTPRPGQFSVPVLSSVWQFATGMLMVSVLSLAATQADKIVLSRMIALKDFGYYVFAANVALVIELSFAPAMTALYPYIVDAISKKREDDLRATFHQTASLVAALTAPVAALLVVFGAKLILTWSGDARLASNTGPLLSIIAIGTFLHAQCLLPYYVQLGYGWTSLSAWTNAAALLITIPSLLFLAPHFGAFAGAWTWLAVASIYFFIALQVMFRRYLRQERLAFYFVDVGPPALAAFGVTGLCSVVLAAVPGSFLGNVFTLGASLTLSLIASVGSALATHPQLRRAVLSALVR
jgi:O-antigen/teichoic acid export membrane protein